MPDHTVDNPEFYEAHWRRTRTAHDPAVLTKAAQLVELVPAGVRSVLDVGCGDGTITAAMAQRFEVTAVDRSAAALAHVAEHSPTVERILASADQLPLADRSRDLVMTSEMLEHLPGPMLQAACRELARVARTWVLVSVPHAENVRRRFLRCPKCRLEFNIYGHLHSLDRARLTGLFGDFEVVQELLSGPAEPASLPAIEQVRQHYGQRWHWWPGLQVQCPACGNEQFAAPKWHAGNRFVDISCDHATRLWARWTGAHEQPYWITLLLRRRDRDG